MANWNPFANGGAAPLTPNAPAPAAQAPGSFDPFRDAGAQQLAAPAADGFNPFQAGASLTDPEQIKARVGSDPSYTPNADELKALYDQEQNETTLQKTGDVLKGAAEGVGQTLHSALVSPVKGVGEFIKDPSAGRLAATALEGISGAASGTVGMVAKPIEKNYEDFKANPLRANLKKLNYLLPFAGSYLADKFAPDTAGEAGQRFQDWSMDYLTKLAAQRGPGIAKSFASAVSGVNPEQVPAPYPEATRATELAASIPMMEAGIRALPIKGLTPEATTTSTEAGLGAKTIAGTGKAVAATGKAMAWAGGLPEDFTKWVTGKISGSPELSEKLSKYVDVGEKLSVPLAVAGGAPIVKAIAAVKMLEGAGKITEGLGNFASRLAEADATQPLGRLYALAQDTSAPQWMRELASSPVVKLAAKTANLTGAAARGAASGAAFGGATSLLSGDNAEETGASIGAGATFGAGFGLLHGPAAALREKQLGALANFVQAHLDAGISPETLAKVSNWDAMQAATAEKLSKGGQKVRFATAQDASSPFAPGGAAEGQAGWADPAGKTFWVDPTKRAASETVLHEFFHGIWDSQVANHPEISKAFDQALKADGKTLDDAKTAYVNAELGYTNDPAAIKTRIAERDMANPNWIYSELLSDAAGRNLYGQDLTQTARPSLAQKVFGAGETQKGGTIFKGFENVLDNKAVSRLTLRAFRNYVDFRPGIDSPVEKQVKLTTQDMGGEKAPMYKLPDGQEINPYGTLVDNGKGGKKFVAFPASEVRRRLKAEQGALDKYFPKGQNVAQVPDAFWNDPAVAPWTKEALKQVVEASKNGSQAEGWYHRLNKENSATSDKSWAADAARSAGNVGVSLQSGFPLTIKRSKHGNLLVDWASMEAARQKAPAWADRHGDTSLDLWGGDQQKFFADSQRYLQNHKEGQPGESNGIGQQKRDVLNAFWFGANKEFASKNPLRSQLRKADRAGIFRSLRVDRLETLHPVEGDFSQPNWEKGKQNLSPADNGEAAQLQALSAKTDRTPEEDAALSTLQAKSAQNNSREAFLKLWQQPKVPDQAVQSVVEQAAAEHQQFSPRAGKSIDNTAPDDVKSDRMKKGELPHAVGDQTIKVVHLSAQGDLKKVDPKFFGKGRANGNDLRGGNKAYFFVKDSPLAGDENIFGKGGYNAYTGEVDGRKLYDLRAGKPDALNYFKTINREEADDNLKAAGYHGVLVETTDGRKVVLMFKPVAVKPAGDFKGDTAKFSPSANPRAVRAAAVRDEEGKIYDGPYHGAAATKYWDTKFPGDLNNELRAWNSTPGLEEGFVTNGGEFLNRDDAYKRAVELEQYAPSKMDDGQLESGRFDRQQKLKAAGYEPAVVNNFSPKAEDERREKLVTNYPGQTAEPWWKQPPVGETETGREASYAGSAENGIVLHSAKERATVFVPKGAQAENFLKRWNGIKSTAKRNSLVESYFTSKKFSPAAGEADKPAPVFYSELEKAVNEVLPDVVEEEPARTVAGREFPAKEIRNRETGEVVKTISARKEPDKIYPAASVAAKLRQYFRGAEVKADELKWSGLDDFLKGKQRVTKEEVQQFLKENQLQVKEVVKGVAKLDLVLNKEETDHKGTDEPIYDVVDRGTGRVRYTGGKPDAMQYIEEEAQTNKGTKHEKWQLPGGENYREILFQLPGKEKTQSKLERFLASGGTFEKLGENYWAAKDNEGATLSEGGSKERALERLEWGDEDQKKTPDFLSRHFDEPNIVAHTRVNDRTDSAGKPGLFAEEIQSDWHQKGRKEGYSVKLSPEEKELDGLIKRIELNGFKSLSQSERARKHELVNAGVGDSLMEKSGKEGVPDAPFKNTWQEFVLRRLICMAAEEGKDWVGWTTGEQQAARYDLSKQISKVRYSLDFGDLEAFDHKGELAIREQGVSPDKIADYVGKEAAEKLMAQEPNESSFRTVEGVDLKVGGEGMKGFYDKILVDYANKFGKKFGAKVEDREVPDAEGFDTESYADYLRRTNQKASELVHRVYEKERQRVVPPSISIHSLSITPEMKASVLKQGVSLFSPAAEKAPELTAKAGEKAASGLDDKAIARYSSRITAETVKNGGASFNVASGKNLGATKAPVFVVSIYPDRSLVLDPKEVTPERVAGFIQANSDLLANKENSVGTWHDPESGKVYLDISWATPDKALAEYGGWKFNQKAIWDLKKSENIPTGGTGTAPEQMAPAGQRLDLMKQEYALQNPQHGQQQMPGMGRVVLNPRGAEVQNVRDLEAVRPDRELSPTEQAASDLARQTLRKQVQLLPTVEDKVKVRRAFQRGLPEVVEFLEKQATNDNFDSGSEWYRKDIAKMEETTKTLFPATKDANKMQMFKVLLAAFSGGATPKENYQLASEAFAHYLKTGEVPATSDFRISETGQAKKLGRQATMTADKLSKMIETLGGEANFVKYLTEKHAETILGNKDAYGALDLGPKFGRFFLNLTGHAGEVTVDLWATRTWQRWMGTPFSRVQEAPGKTKMAMPDIPTDAERNNVISAFHDIAQEVNKTLPAEKHVEPMDVQAVLWFYEKDLYAARGVKVDRGSFSEAAKEYAKKPLHLAEKPVITGAKRKVDPNQLQLMP